MTSVRPASTIPVDVASSGPVLAIDAGWMTGALSVNQPGVVVRSCERLDVLQGSAVKIRVRLSYDDADQAAKMPAVMIIKGPFDRHDAQWMNPTISCEMHAYADIVVPSGVNSPAIYFAGDYPAPGHPLMIMEDLVARGVRFNSALRALTVDEARRMLDLLARFHARWWESPRLTAQPIASWIEPANGPEVMGYLRSRLRPEVWARYTQMPRGSGLPGLFKDAERLQAALEQLDRIYSAAPVTAVHGDFHLGNTFFDRDGRAGAYDWCVRRGPWQHDVAYFVPNALDIVDRRDHEQGLLRHYLDRLAAYGVTPPAYERAWADYRKALLYGLLIWIANGDDSGQFQPESINTAGAVRHAWAALDHDTLGLLAGA
jgi:hypothetical protein